VTRTTLLGSLAIGAAVLAYALPTPVGAVPRNPNAGRGYPAAMVGVPLRALW
jgi:hypothetical protein